MKLLGQRSAELGEGEKTCRTEQDVQLILQVWAWKRERKWRMEDHFADTKSAN